jgi:predicted AAA+ superfamily ATPase
MIPRAAEPLTHELLRGFPIVTLTGPRQSGKTTLARKVMADRPYRSLEDPDIRALALDDPRGFLAQCPNGAVLDEIQRTPELFSYLQTRVDHDGRMGQFLLTGSQQFGLLSNITQSLAGRSAFVELLPLTHDELAAAGQATTDLDTQLFTGGYPALYDRPVAPRHWFAAYVTAYLERDVRQLVNVQDLDSFQRFVRLCAGRSGQVLNLSTLAGDCGITHNTARGLDLGAGSKLCTLPATPAPCQLQQAAGKGAQTLLPRHRPHVLAAGNPGTRTAGNPPPARSRF